MSQPPMNPNGPLHQMMPGNPNPMMPVSANHNAQVGNMPSGNMAQLGGMVPANLAGQQNMLPIGNPNAPATNAQQAQQSTLGGNPAAAPIPSHPTAPTQNQNQDPNLARLKTILPQLKKSMNDLMEIAGGNINYNSNIDNSVNQKPNQPKPEELPNPPSRFDKALEDFYSICNQLELCLRTVLECAIQTRDSNSYLPFQVMKDLQTDIQPPSMMNDNSLNYHQYLNLIKKQVTYARTIYETLSDTVKQIKQTDQPMMQQAPPQQQLNQGNPVMQQLQNIS